jgi:hypothetical protein
MHLWPQSKTREWEAANPGGMSIRRRKLALFLLRSYPGGNPRADETACLTSSEFVMVEKTITLLRGKLQLKIESDILDFFSAQDYASM